MREISFIVLALVLLSCGSKKKNDENVLLRFEDREITYSQVMEMIPDGIFPTDSAALFNTIMEGWIRDEVLAEFAEEHLYDLQSIDRRVRDYRNSLIVQEYLTRMRESHSPKIDEQRVKEYYDRHRNELKLEVPLIKGVFLKISSDASRKEEIKGLLTSDNPEKIDQLERNWLDRALEYDYFRDKWLDWETVAGKIPHRFGDPNRFLEENNYFETEYGDCSYYLYVAEWLAPGEEQPFEFARGWITNVLTQGELAEYERALVSSLVSKYIKENKLEVIGYDPLLHELIENSVKEEYE